MVQRIRRRTIALRQATSPLSAPGWTTTAALSLDAAEAVIGAFGLYFGLVNLAEARAGRALRRRGERAARILDDSVADAVPASLAARRSMPSRRARRRLACPVFTAHRPRNRRTTLSLALAVLLAAGRPALTPSEDRDVRRRLREEITLLWRTADLRVVSPTPLDEVRPRWRLRRPLFSMSRGCTAPSDAARPTDRSVTRAASDSGRTGTRSAPVGRSYGQHGSVATATATRASPRDRADGAHHADHVLRG
jgi:phosphoenolpyruvate carboxylase